MPEHYFNTPRPVRLEVKVASGDVHVTTADGDESAVTLEGSPKMTEATRVVLIGERLIIEHQRKSLLAFFEAADQSLHVRVRVPHRSRVQIVTASADATVGGTLSELEMKSASGAVAVTGEVEGDARVETVSGDVRLARLGGDLTVRTVSGDVEAESARGSVSAKSVSGDVRVGSLREGRVAVQSVSGDVELGIAPGTAIDVDAASASGDLSSEVPLSDTRGDDTGPTVVIRSNTVSGGFRVFRAAA
jgi:DUF4097 and DUF4098 domain-containing protein YvlB